MSFLEARLKQGNVPEIPEELIRRIVSEEIERLLRKREEALREASLLERIVRVEEALLAQTEVIKSLQREMNARFEALLREMDSRFEAVNERFEVIDKRFESLEKRFDMFQRVYYISFIFLTAFIAVLKFLF